MPDFLRAFPDHDHIEVKGHKKLHGLVVLYRRARYRVRASKTIYFDEEHINTSSPAEKSPETESLPLEEMRRRRGGTRTTKNVGVVVALEDAAGGKDGLVVSTCHL